jgi:hypothetical protein
MGNKCTENCHGRMIQEYDDARLHTQIKYLETLFDFKRSEEKAKKDPANVINHRLIR